MNTPIECYAQAKLRCDWAYKYINNLREYCSIYANSRPCSISLKEKMKTGEHIFRTDSVAAPPPQISFAIGDIAHNLRSALDNVAYALILLRGGNIEEVGFPIARNAIELEQVILDRHFNLVGDEAVNVLRALEISIGGEGESLFHLNSINTAEKYGQPILSSMGIGMIYPRESQLSEGNAFSDQEAFVSPVVLRTDTILPAVVPPKDFNMKTTPQLVVEVCFSEEMDLPKANVITNMNWIWLGTQRAINAFEHFFK